MSNADCPDCGRPLDTTRGERGEAYCYNCSLPFEVGQCEGCGDRYAEEDMTTENAPGATLWFCPECTVTRERGRVR
jgi:hypothetical protein